MTLVYLTILLPICQDKAFDCLIREVLSVVVLISTSHFTILMNLSNQNILDIIHPVSKWVHGDAVLNANNLLTQSSKLTFTSIITFTLWSFFSLSKEYLRYISKLAVWMKYWIWSSTFLSNSFSVKWHN